MQRVIKDLLHVRHIQRLQDKDLATGQKGRDDLERGVLCSSADKDYGPVLYGSQKGILLGLAETVDLIYEQHRRSSL